MTDNDVSWQLKSDHLDQIKGKYGTPCYVYDLALLKKRASHLRMLFGDYFSLSYAVKANPNHQIISTLMPYCGTFDVSSIGEVHRVMAAGVNATDITFSGPAKRDDEMQQAIAVGVGEIVIESLDECQRLAKLCAQSGHQQDVLVRIYPDTTPNNFGASMAGMASQFGIEECQLEQALLEIQRQQNLRLRGFHIYAGSNSLSADAIVENVEIMLDSFERANAIVNAPMPRLVFGAGFGIPYNESEAPLDLHDVAARVQDALHEKQNSLALQECKLSLELGRWLVGPAGLLVTSVVTQKISKEKRICLCDAGFNNHLAAFGLMGSVIKRNWRIKNLSSGSEQKQRYNLVGPLCTSIDLLAQNLELPTTRAGDLLAIEMSGAYGLTASPVGFISHPVPKELAVDGESVFDISGPLTADKLFKE